MNIYLSNLSATYVADGLFLAVSGPLEGKFLLKRIILKAPAYLKICSSVLGYGYIPTLMAELLISEKLDLNVLTSPTGAYEPFKRSATTICKGRGWAV